MRDLQAGDSSAGEQPSQQQPSSKQGSAAATPPAVHPPRALESIDAVVQLLAPLSSLRSIALDGFCYEGLIDSSRLISAETDKLVREHFRFTDAVYARALAFRRAHSLRRYVAAHWRRGDLDFAHPDVGLLSATPAALARQLLDAMHELCTRPQDVTERQQRLQQPPPGGQAEPQPLQSSYCGFDGVYLTTDLFLLRDLPALEALLPVRVLRHTGESRVENLAMDIVLSAGAERLVSTYSGTRFSVCFLLLRFWLMSAVLFFIV